MACFVFQAAFFPFLFLLRLLFALKIGKARRSFCGGPQSVENPPGLIRGRSPLCSIRL